MFEGYDKKRVLKSAGWCGGLILADWLLHVLVRWTYFHLLISVLLVSACLAISLYKGAIWSERDIVIRPQAKRRWRSEMVYIEGQTGQNTTMAEEQIWSIGAILAMVIAVYYPAFM